MRRILLTLLLVLALPVSAMAEGFSITEWSARGVALTGGLVARTADPSTVAYNPAGMSQLLGTQMMLGMTVINPGGRISGTDRNGQYFSKRADNKYWPMPHFYLTHQLNDKFWVGLGVFTRFGLGNSFSKDWPGRNNFISAKVESVTLNPNIAWKLTDKFTAAFGVEFFGITMEQKLNNPLAARPGLAGLSGNNMTMRAYGLNMAANVGLRYAFNEQWALGFTWRSRISATVHGMAKFDNEAAVRAATGGRMGNSGIGGTMYLPDTLSLGLAWQPTERLSLELTVSDTLWSTYKSLDIDFTGWGTSQVSPKRWKDSYAISLSAEYKALDWLTLRAGYSYETSPMNLDYADYMLPTNGRHRIGLGAGATYGNWTFDLGYAYFIIKPLSYSRSKATGIQGFTNNTRASGVNAHAIAFSVGYSF